MIAAGEMNVGLVMNVLFAIVLASLSISQILPLIESFSKATAAAQKIFQTINRVPPIDSYSTEGLQPETIFGDIEFENVSFVYPSRPEGITLRYCVMTISSGVEGCLIAHSGGKVYRNCRSLRIWKVNYHSTNRKIL